MMYAFSRDGGIPGHKFFHKVDKKRQSPIRTVWLACTLSFILGLPSLGSSVAFSAATSIATIGLYISYGIIFSSPSKLWTQTTLDSYPSSAACNIQRQIRSGSIPSRSFLISGCHFSGSVDRFHIYRVCTSSGESC